ncbi:MAG: hypothetical protein OXG65_14290 [Chloroflexi bacterium]|nr:hypothetical protein [Chloroflexota bacterium]
MEEEVRDILRTALNRQPAAPANLASTIRASFAPLDSVELDLPARSPRCRPLPSAEEAAVIVLNTNIVSDLMQPDSYNSIVAAVAGYGAPSQYVSTISEAGRLYGAEILPAGQRHS